MNAFPDTSFLFALYRPQDNSPAAQKYYAAMTEPVHVSGLLLYEFRQSVQFQVWLHGNNPKKGIPDKEGVEALADLEVNIADGAVVIVPAEWADVHQIAERLSNNYTKAEGHRAFDVLHVATALHLGAREFLSFDARQRKLAKIEDLKVRP
jgi:predicted nucleic acid-binding protein